MLVGTVAELSLLESAMLTPPLGAGRLRVITPVAVTPPLTELGATVNEASRGSRVRVADRWTLPSVAVIVAVVRVVTALVLTVKVALVLPAGIVTLELEPTVAAWLLLARVTLIPPVGAGLSRVTVPVLDAPSATIVGLSVSDIRAGARTARGAVLLTPA